MLRFQARYAAEARALGLPGEPEDAEVIEARPVDGALELTQRRGKTFLLHVTGIWKSYFGRAQVVATSQPELARELFLKKEHSELRAERYGAVGGRSPSTPPTRLPFHAAVLTGSHRCAARVLAVELRRRRARQGMFLPGLAGVLWMQGEPWRKHTAALRPVPCPPTFLPMPPPLRARAPPLSAG